METIIERDDLKRKFLLDAIEHGKAIDIGDYKAANKIHKKLTALYNKAKNSNQINVFSEMLNEQNENVRLWAATFTLKYSPVLAEKTLFELSASPTIRGVGAKTTLALWKENRLNLL